MSILGDKQRRFTKAKGELIVFAFSIGYELSDGDANRDERLHGKFGEKKGYGAANSMHKLRLAQDFNLFIKNEWIKKSSHRAWGVLHAFWEARGGAQRIPGDANHFSFEHNGMR